MTASYFAWNRQMLKAMKKRHIILSTFFIYTALIFLLAIRYELEEESSTAFMHGIALMCRFLLISFVAGWVMLVFAHAVLYSGVSVFFVLMAPFLYFLAELVVMVAVDMVLSITFLGEVISLFQQAFLTMAISTLLTGAWMLGDVFRKETQLEDRD